MEIKFLIKIIEVLSVMLQVIVMLILLEAELKEKAHVTVVAFLENP